MNHIVLDLEFDKISKMYRHPDMATRHEIIEIGAVKLDKNYNTVDCFSTFVKPDFIQQMSSSVSKLTGITSENLADAPRFSQAADEFSAWAGKDGTYDIYAWSDNDEYQFTGEMELKNLENPVENAEWIDLQAIFNDEVGLERCVSLENAADWLNIEKTGRQHRALDDALNTAEILRILNNETELKRRLEPIQEILHPQKQHSATLADILGFDLTAAYAAACSAV